MLPGSGFFACIADNCCSLLHYPILLMQYRMTDPKFAVSVFSKSVKIVKCKHETHKQECKAVG